MKAIRLIYKFLWVIWIILALSSIFQFPIEVTYAQIGKLIQRGVYGIKVISVEKKDSYLVASGNVLPIQTDHILLIVEFEIFEQGNRVKLSVGKFDEALLNLSVVDSRGKVYTTMKEHKVLFTMDAKELFSKEWKDLGWIAIFSVPKNSTGFKLRYRDLPPIDLEL